jgi:threonine dehydrogenase-like Zn-dependent dehydrogenase
MKAIALRGTSLVEVDQEEVKPGRGQVLVSTLACGICGSDLHAAKKGLREMLGANAQENASGTLDPSKDLVMGHEFCAEVLDHGPGCTHRLKAGARVVSVPYVVGPGGQELVGFSTRYPGGFGERMVLTEERLLEVPNGLASEHAALTEPMSVGAHAVESADLSGRPVALVIGCGPIGLAVIAALKRRGVGPVIACDYAEARRALAEQMGADIVLDPAETSPHGYWERFDVPATLAELSRAELGGRSTRQPIIFECVGAKGLIQSILEQGPPLAQVVLIGTCAEPDTIVPVLALRKQLRLTFVYAYTPDEFAATLDDIAEGRIDVTPMLNRQIGRSEVASAFAELALPNLAKIVVDPRRA